MLWQHCLFVCSLFLGEMLSDRCPVCPLCDVGVLWPNGWMDQDEAWHVGLGPGHFVLDGDPSPPPPKGHSPQFLARICCGQIAGWIKMPFGMEEGLGPGDFVLDGDPASPPQKGGKAPNFRPVSTVAQQLDGTRWHLAWRWASVQATLC